MLNRVFGFDGKYIVELITVVDSNTHILALEINVTNIKTQKKYFVSENRILKVGNNDATLFDELCYIFNSDTKFIKIEDSESDIMKLTVITERDWYWSDVFSLNETFTLSQCDIFDHILLHKCKNRQNQKN